MEPGLRWIKHPAALTPIGREQPERMAALAMLTVAGLLVYGLMQRQVRLYLQEQEQHGPGNTGPTTPPTAAVVMALFTPGMLGPLQVDKTVVRQGYGWQDHHPSGLRLGVWTTGRRYHRWSVSGVTIVETSLRCFRSM